MDTDRAIEIVQNLADGVDPYSGERLALSAGRHRARAAPGQRGGTSTRAVAEIL
jgi:hypothetical protein